MIKIRNLFIVLFFGNCLQAATITWVAPSPSNDIEDTTHWSPNSVPGNSDIAVFNSSLSDISTNPTENSTPFSVSSFNFPTLASPFIFTFNNQRLAFSGTGITGTQKNPSLAFTNTNNSNALGNALSFAGSGTIGSATVAITNSATLSGAQSGQNRGTMDSHIHSVGTFTIDDRGTITATSMGHDSTTALGGNFVAVNNASQLKFDNGFTAGNDVAVSAHNNGTCDGSNSANINQTAYLNDNQFFVGEVIECGEQFNLAISNNGNDSSTGVGQNQVALINSNSGTTGDQVLLLQGGTMSSNATVAVTNSGRYSGTNTVGGSQVGGMNQGQCTVGDSTSIGSYNFSAQDNFNLTVSNNGTDSATGTGGDAIGSISINQAAFFTPCVLGDKATITLSNEGRYTGSASTSYVNVGSVGSHQFTAASTFEAGDDFMLHITNQGNNSGSGIGGFFIGDIINAQQASFEQGLTVGKRATITITNSGSNSASTTNNNQVGSMMGYGKQLLIRQALNAGDDLSITVANSGIDTSTASGGNFVGFMNNNTADGTASQTHLANGGAVGNNASITISNAGTFEGNNAGNNATAVLGGSQFASVAAFQAGDQFSCNVSMIGTNNGLGQNNNSVAVLGGSGSSQIDFQSDCTVGNNASFSLSNNGVNNDASGTNNTIGYITNAQMNIVGAFSAGTDLNINISNSATNAGDVSNLVGNIVHSQLSFGQECTLRDKSTIAVTNSGTVGASQIFFNQGFDIVSGKATIHAINNGAVANHGIEIQGNNAGGNAEIIINKSSLYVATSLADFTIAGLQGDVTSIAQSQPRLIINRDGSTQTEFAGSIQDFSEIVPTVLVKRGSGTQILSGANSYTGLTTIEQGTLVINGSLPGDVLIQPLGTLKGSGAVNGTLTNAGTIAPGQSIGTMTIGNYVNNGANYEVEVNGVGQSDLIHALGTATINGGAVIVAPEDFNFSAPITYTIMSADSGVTGQFSSLTSTVPSLMRLIYNPLNVQLFYLPLVTNAGLSCNAANAARCFTGLDGTDVTAINNALFTLNVDAINDAFEQMSPAQFSGPSQVQLLTAILVRTTYTKHMQEQRSNQNNEFQHHLNVWTNGFAQWQKQGNAFGYDDRTLGTTIGIDYTQRNWALSSAFSIANDNFHWSKFTGKATINSYYGGIYGQWNCKRFCIDTAFMGTFSDYKTTREINFATIDKTACASHHGNGFLIHGGLQYQTYLSRYQLSPYFNIDYAFQHERDYTESGAESLNLHVNSENEMLLQVEIGVSLDATYRVHKGTLMPSLSFSYVNQTPFSGRSYHAHFINSTCVFNGKGGDYKGSLFAPSLALTYQSAHDCIKTSVYYDGQIGNKYWAQDIVFDIAICF